MAYNVKYRIPFVDTNDLPYEILISTKDAVPEVKELIPGKEPIIVSYKDGDDIYNPLRFAGATITILVERPLFDLYVTEPHQYKVDLKQGEDIKYTGFITPEVFSQDYNGYLTEFQIESISALATTEHFKMDISEVNELYFLLGGYSKPGAAGILNRMLTLISESYTAIYIPKFTGVSDSNDRLSSLYVLVQNFVDEDDEIWTYKEFLEELCKLWGWTLTEKDAEVWFLDVNYMKNYNSYFKYSGSDFSLVDRSYVTSATTQLLSENESEGSNNNLEMVAPANKITIRANNYEFISSFPKLENLSYFPYNDPKKYEKLFQEGRSYQNQKWDLYRYRNPSNENLIMYLYNNSSDNPIENYPDSYDGITGAGYYKGCTIGRHQRYKKDSDTEIDWEYGALYVFKNFVGIPDDSGRYNVSPTDTSNNTILRRGGIDGGVTTYPPNDTYPTGLPCMKMKTPLALYANTSVNINFEVAITKELYGAFPDIRVWRNDNFNDVVVPARKFFIPVEIKLGDYYWNGIRWVKSKTHTRIDLAFSGGDHTSSGFFKKIVSNVSSFSPLPINATKFTEGYTVPIDKERGIEGAEIGQIEITFYYPRYHMWRTNADHRGATFAFIAEPTIQLASEEKDTHIDYKKDTLFTGIQSDTPYLTDLDDVELKLCSSAEDEPIKAYSRIIDYDDDHALSTLPHYGITTDEMIRLIDRPEHHLISKYLYMYSKPRIRLIQDTNVNYKPYQFMEDSTFPGRKFFITGEEINYRDNRSNLKMEEII